MAKLTAIVETDLRSITRGSERTESVISIEGRAGDSEVWLRFGEVQMRWNKNTGLCTIAARMTKGVTDFEHDSAYAFQLPVIGLHMQEDYGVEYSIVRFRAWVTPNDQDFRDFRVPREAYDPAKLKGAYMCADKRCDPSHLIVPEEHYAGPPSDAELFKLVRGKRLDILINLPPKKAGEEG